MAGMLLSLTACSNDDSAAGEEQSTGPVPITLQTSVVSVGTRVSGQSIQNTEFEKDEELNIYITENIPANGKAGGSYNPKYEYKVSDENGSLKPMSLSSPYYPLNTNTIAIYATYPKTVTNDVQQYFSVKADQTLTTSYKSSDLMFSNNLTNQAKVAAPVTLEFNHKLCKININLEMYHAPEDPVDNSSLEGARVYLKDVSRTISFNGKTGNVVEPSNSGDVLVTNNGMYASSAIIVPQVIPSRNFIRIEMTTNKDILNYTLPTQVTFESGKAYTFNIMVKQDVVVVGNYTVEDWDATPDPVNTTKQFEN